MTITTQAQNRADIDTLANRYRADFPILDQLSGGG